VGVLLEDCSEGDLDIVRALLKPSGEMKVVCKCSILENFFFCLEEEITAHGLDGF